jgi:hypothetical protein
MARRSIYFFDEFAGVINLSYVMHLRPRMHWREGSAGLSGFGLSFCHGASE